MSRSTLLFLVVLHLGTVVHGTELDGALHHGDISKNLSSTIWKFKNSGRNELAVLRVVVQTRSALKAERNTLYFVRHAADEITYYMLEPKSHSQHWFQPGPLQWEAGHFNGTPLQESEIDTMISRRLQQIASKTPYSVAAQRWEDRNGYSDAGFNVAGAEVSVGWGAFSHSLSQIDLFTHAELPKDFFGDLGSTLASMGKGSFIDFPMKQLAKQGRLVATASEPFSTWSGPDPFMASVGTLAAFTATCMTILKLLH